MWILGYFSELTLYLHIPFEGGVIWVYASGTCFSVIWVCCVSLRILVISTTFFLFYHWFLLDVWITVGYYCVFTTLVIYWGLFWCYQFYHVPLFIVQCVSDSRLCAIVFNLCFGGSYAICQNYHLFYVLWCYLNACLDIACIVVWHGWIIWILGCLSYFSNLSSSGLFDILW